MHCSGRVLTNCHYCITEFKISARKSRLEGEGRMKLNLRDLVRAVREHFSVLTEKAVSEARTYVLCVEGLEIMSRITANHRTVLASLIPPISVPSLFVHTSGTVSLSQLVACTMSCLIRTCYFRASATAIATLRVET